MKRLLWFLAGLLAASAGSHTNPASVAQNPPVCGNVVIPVAAFREGMFLLGLKDSQIKAEFRGQTSVPVAFTTDDSPKRIAIIVDNSSRLSAEPGKIVAAMVAELVSKARLNEKLALMTYGGAVIKHDFTADRQALLGVASQFQAGTPAGSPAGPDLASTLREVIRWFGSPQFGDSVLLFVGGHDQTDEATSKKFTEELIGHGIRVFTVLLSQRSQTGMYYSGRSTDVPLSPDSEELHNVTHATGGVFFVENTAGITRSYKVTDERLKQLRLMIYQWYGAMQLPYRLELANPRSSKFEKVEVVFAQKQDPGPKGRRLYYPESVAPCTTK